MSSSTSSASSSSPKDNKYPQWHNVAAGAAAGAGARLLTAPLDLLKIRRQLQTSSATLGLAATESFKNPRNFIKSDGVISNMAHIVKNEGGIKGLFRGNVAATYLWIGYAAVQFSLYARTSNFLTSFGTANNIHNTPHSLPATTSPSSPLISMNNINPPIMFQNLLSQIGSNPAANAFCSGATAGVAATLLTYPFDICRTIFAAKGISSSSVSSASAKVLGAATNGSTPPPPPNSLIQFVHTMYAKNGVRGFFVGCVPAVIQIIPYMGINFALYDYLVRVGTVTNRDGNQEKGENKKKKIDASSAGMAGFIAGGTSKILVYPMDTVKKRLQAQTFMLTTTTPGGSGAMAMNMKNSGMLNCIITIAKQEGLPAFYKGLVPTALKSMVGTGFSFFFFTFTKNTLETIHDSTSSLLK